MIFTPISTCYLLKGIHSSQREGLCKDVAVSIAYDFQEGLCKGIAVSVAYDFTLGSVAVDLWNRKWNPWKKEPKQDSARHRDRSQGEGRW